MILRIIFCAKKDSAKTRNMPACERDERTCFSSLNSCILPNRTLPVISQSYFFFYHKQQEVTKDPPSFAVFKYIFLKERLSNKNYHLKNQFPVFKIKQDSDSSLLNKATW